MRKLSTLVGAGVLMAMFAGCAALDLEMDVAPPSPTSSSTAAPAQNETGAAAPTTPHDQPALSTESVQVEASPTPAPTQDVRGSKPWQTLPVIPAVSQRTVEMYRLGLQAGRDPHRFSVIGECESELSWYVGDTLIYGYLAGFDDPSTYRLGTDYAFLQEAIDQFQPSFSQVRVAAHRGMNAAQVLSPLYSDAELCDVRESPLECEVRRNNPSIVLVSMETWFYDRPISTYETYMRNILDYLIEQNIVPVLVTAAENHSHSQDLNAILAQLAREYDVPLWNFWRAAQELPNGGVEEQPDENGFRHLTYAPNHFDDPQAMQAGWPIRNLTGLQVLDAVWRAGAGLPQVNPNIGQ